MCAARNRRRLLLAGGGIGSLIGVLYLGRKYFRPATVAPQDVEMQPPPRPPPPRSLRKIPTRTTFPTSAATSAPVAAARDSKPKTLVSAIEPRTINEVQQMNADAMTLRASEIRAANSAVKKYLDNLAHEMDAFTTIDQQNTTLLDVMKFVDQELEKTEKTLESLARDLRTAQTTKRQTDEVRKEIVTLANQIIQEKVSEHQYRLLTRILTDTEAYIQRNPPSDPAILGQFLRNYDISSSGNNNNIKPLFSSFQDFDNWFITNIPVLNNTALTNFVKTRGDGYLSEKMKTAVNDFLAQNGPKPEFLDTVTRKRFQEFVSQMGLNSDSLLQTKQQLEAFKTKLTTDRAKLPKTMQTFGEFCNIRLRIQVLQRFLRATEEAIERLKKVGAAPSGLLHRITTSLVPESLRAKFQRSSPKQKQG